MKSLSIALTAIFLTGVVFADAIKAKDTSTSRKATEATEHAVSQSTMWQPMSLNCATYCRY